MGRHDGDGWIMAVHSSGSIVPLAFLLCGATCTTATTQHTRTEQQLSVDAGAVLDATSHATSERETGPVDSLTVVEEYVPARAEVAGVGIPPPIEGIAPPPVLFRRTTTHTISAPVSERSATDGALHAAASLQTHEERRVDSEQAHATATRAGPPWWVWVLVLVVLLVVGVALWRILRSVPLP
jgi:hypothetical protein